METHTIASIEALSEFVQNLVGKLPVREEATTVTLTGDLGAGKTTFVQQLAKNLAVTETITSPTFVVMKQYDIENNDTKFTQLIHIDAYRIEDSAEMTVLGFEGLLTQPKTLICIEWPEKIQELIPENAVQIELATTETEGERIITIHGN